MKVADLFASLGLNIDKRSFGEGDRLLGAVKKAVVGIVAFKTVKFFGGLINETRHEADEIAKMSRKVGLSVEALQQLEFAAQISGSNLDILRVGLQRFSRGADDAKRGSKESADTFKQLGVNAKALINGTLPLDEALMQVADTFQGMPDGPKKTALAMKAFGRSGAELIPFFNEGREGIGKLRQEFVDLGAQIDGKTAAQFEELNDDELRVRTALKGIRNEVVIGLLPTLKEMVTSLLEWIKANRALIRSKLRSVLKGLVGIMKFLAKALAFVVENWKALLILMISARVLSGIAKLITMYRALGLTSLTAGLQAAAGWVAATLPLLLLAALVGGAILLVADMFGVFGDDSAIGRFREGMIDAFVAVYEWIGKLIQGAVDYYHRWTDSIDAIRNQGKIALQGLQAEAAKIFISTHLDELKALRAEVGHDIGDLPEQQLMQMIMDRRVKMAGGSGGAKPVTNNNNFSPQINVTAGDNAEGGSIAKAVHEKISEFWDSKMREAEAATSQ